MFYLCEKIKILVVILAPIDLIALTLYELDPPLFGK